mmetsp:Transcript_12597/g.27223  ORF Transcript_12597/g.27223 Transcript_12597/m.27223 type:complete len:217 (+) Transcript_12597:693-1343(+)
MRPAPPRPAPPAAALAAPLPPLPGRRLSRSISLRTWCRLDSRKVSTSLRCKSTSCARRLTFFSSRVLSLTRRRRASASDWASPTCPCVAFTREWRSFSKSLISCCRLASRLEILACASLIAVFCCAPLLAYCPSSSALRPTSRISRPRSSSRMRTSFWRTSVSCTWILSSSAMRLFCCRMRFTLASSRSSISSSALFLSSSIFCSYSLRILVLSSR